MYSPFKKRATEYLGDGQPFLDIVIPDLFESLFAKHVESGAIFDRLVRVIAAPGSGKTTLAKLFQYDNALLVQQNPKKYRSIHRFLTSAGVIEVNRRRPTILGCRLPTESEYRDFWELPYTEELRNDLLISFIQARAILAWSKQLSESGTDLSTVLAITRAESPAGIEAMGGTMLSGIRDRAAEVERAIYDLVAALVPSLPEELPSTLQRPYKPFNFIRRFVVDSAETQPLLVLDDVHVLQVRQRQALSNWLTRRELQIGRWALMRVDALDPSSALSPSDDADETQNIIPKHVSQRREILTIKIQGESRAFDQAARKMGDRYLEQIQIFERRGVTSLGVALSGAPPVLSPETIDRLNSEIVEFCRRENVSLARMRAFGDDVDTYLRSDEPDVRLAAIQILLHRYVNRVPQTALFLGEYDAEPTRPIAANHGIIEGARIQLLHRERRPFYYGLERVIAAATGNAEHFLTLAAPLTDVLETQLLGRRSSAKFIPAAVQHRLLRTAVRDQISGWTWPENPAVLKIVEHIGRLCVARTLEPTAPLDAGANAIGIPTASFSRLFSDRALSRLANVLKYGLAYNAFYIRSGLRVKDKEWSVLQLGGMLCIHYGLTLRLGGFIDSVSLEDLAALVEDE